MMRRLASYVRNANERLNRDAFAEVPENDSPTSDTSDKSDNIDVYTKKTLREFNDDLDEFAKISPKKPLAVAGMVIIAITFLSDLKLSASGGLVPELPTDATFKGPTFDDSGTTRAQINSFGTVTQTAKNGAESKQVDGDNLFPKGITIYGRWTQFKLSGADSTGGAIFYFGY